MLSFPLPHDRVKETFPHPTNPTPQETKPRSLATSAHPGRLSHPHTPHADTFGPYLPVFQGPNGDFSGGRKAGHVVAKEKVRDRIDHGLREITKKTKKDTSTEPSPVPVHVAMLCTWMEKDFVGAEDVSVVAVGVVLGNFFPIIFSLPEGRARSGLGGKLQRPGSDNNVPFQPKTRKETR